MRIDLILSATISTIGAVSLLMMSLRFVRYLRKFFIRESYDHGLRYGQHTWALITAPTSTTGSGFAFQLAKRGFNIVLVGRDIERIHRLRDAVVLNHLVKVSIVGVL